MAWYAELAVPDEDLATGRSVEHAARGSCRCGDGRAPVALASVLASTCAEGVEMVAWSTGDLDVRFTDGSAIRAGHSENAYEAWTLHGPDGLMVVSMPAASGVAVWGPRS